MPLDGLKAALRELDLERINTKLLFPYNLNITSQVSILLEHKTPIFHIT